MNTRSVYDRVCLTSPVDQNKFIQYFNDAVRYLVSNYDDKYVFEKDTDYSEIQHINDMSGVRNVYFDCIIDGVISSVAKDEGKKAAFVSKADLAYKKVWRGFAKYRRRHGDVW